MFSVIEKRFAGQMVSNSIKAAPAVTARAPISGFRGRPGLGGDSAGKEPVATQVKLSSGQTVMVRRIENKDAGRLTGFLERSKLAPQAFHDEYFFKRSHSRSDALIAVTDGKAVGMATISPDPSFFSGPMGPSFSKDFGYEEGSICFGEFRVDPDLATGEITWGMINTQLQAAKQAGFQAVGFETGCKATKEVAQAMGGTVQEGEGTTWVVVPVTPSFKGPR